MGEPLRATPDQLPFLARSASAAPANCSRKRLIANGQKGQHQRSMKPDETHELSDEEVFRLLENAALSARPNPSREGCPDEAVLARFARDPRSFPMHDPVFEHLAACPECFRQVQHGMNRARS
jgi:hypothetical protein